MNTFITMPVKLRIIFFYSCSIFKLWSPNNNIIWANNITYPKYPKHETCEYDGPLLASCICAPVITFTRLLFPMVTCSLVTSVLGRIHCSSYP